MRRLCARVARWWCLRGRFSLPVRALSPGRRAAHAEMRRRAAAPGSTEALRRAVADHARRPRPPGALALDEWFRSRSAVDR
ncbi:hypothetical protein AB0O82_33820 [Kitasatospora sp. NPDC088264]|uniref:hypothetical protein n=1 Tax=unclassified Kitasatospora TaxID=2633591 RepID=UPI0034361708